MDIILAEYGSYLLIPFIAALAGWGTNWLAIKMTFYPLEYVGVFPFGWRGVVPSRIRKFASGLVDTTIGRVGGLPMMLDSIDATEVKAHFLNTASPMIGRVVHDLMREQKRVMWENLPAATKKRVFQLVEDEMREGFDALADDMRANFERLLDLRELVVRRCEETPDLLNKLIFACAGREISFLVFSGAFFGFGFGVVQALAWYLFPPVVDFTIFWIYRGYADELDCYSADIFPVEPLKVGPFVFQGLFLKRQKEIANEFSRVFTQDIITAKEVVQTLLHGKNSHRTVSLLRMHVSDIMEQKVVVQFITQVATGPEGYADLKDAALEKAIEYSEELAEDSSFTQVQAKAVQEILEERLSAQSPTEFQDIIRPIFHEDEWILVSIGGALGALVGRAQLVYLFA